MREHAPRPFVTLQQGSKIVVDPVRGRFSSWYELFPRSASPDPSQHGTLRDVERGWMRSPRWDLTCCICRPFIRSGERFERAEQSPVAEPGDVGSPWAIGGPEGGHDAIHPGSGTFDGFRSSRSTAASNGGSRLRWTSRSSARQIIPM